MLGNNLKGHYSMRMRLSPVAEGQIVDVIAPASRCSRDELRAGVKAVLELGLVPRVPQGLFAPSVLFSNRDEVRLRQLRAALYAPDSGLIWCVRGGYGSLRLVPEMLKWRRPSRPKILLGFSDVTTLHSFLNFKWGWPTLHGPMIDRFGRSVMSARERDELLDLLFGRVDEVRFRVRLLGGGARPVSGVVVGGNMAVLQSSLGTPLQLSGRGRILFFEDIGERPHRVDRMLSQFAQAGVFRGARAVVFGHFQLSDAKDRRQLWSDVIPRFVRDVGLPVYAGLPVGHSPRLQMTLPLGVRGRIAGGELSVASPI
jgi:muramoyltetrapeptide carboxypeptidase